MQTTLSRIFMNGNSQAVRIPHALRLDASEVEIYRNDDGDLVLHPLAARATDRGAALANVLAGFDAQFVATLEADRAQAAPSEVLAQSDGP